MKDMNFSSIGHYPYKTKYDDLGQFLKIYLGTGDPQTKTRPIYVRVIKTSNRNEGNVDGWKWMVSILWIDDLLSSVSFNAKLFNRFPK